MQLSSQLSRQLCFLRIILISLPLLIIGCDAGDGDGLDENGLAIENTPAAIDLFSRVQSEVFTARCIACHIGASAPLGLDLSEGNAYANIVSVTSTQQSTMMLISPNNPEESYLVKKIRGDSDITGAQMPRNGPPFLSDNQIQLVIDWVNAGAKATASSGAEETINAGAEETTDDNEFVATLSDFTNYASWQAIDYSIDASNPALGTAHKGDDAAYSRRTYKNATAQASTGEYAIGSILVKEVVTWQDGDKEFSPMAGLNAMVKRGGEFNSGNGGWEWFDIASDVTAINGQGADLMGGMCDACHSQAESQTGGLDYVFPYPSEYIASAADFADYEDWELIEKRSDQNSLLGEIAHKADDPDAIRRIYKKQLYAYPDTAEQGYPVGTIIVLEVEQNDAITEVTAMVKRGGTFNTDNHYWEWFMLAPLDLSIMVDDSGEARGANLMGGMCNSCHSGANPTTGDGIDYVFEHKDDPFNHP